MRIQRARRYRGAPLTKRQRLALLKGALEQERQSWLPVWRELNDFILPTRGRFLATDTQRGKRRTEKIIDSTATFAAGTLSAGMMSGMTSPAKPWFRLTTSDLEINEKASVKMWLHQVTQRLSTVFLRSNLYNQLPQVYEDVGVFGTGALAVLEDDETVIRCESYPIGSYWIALDEKRRVRVFWREWDMTVRQVVDEFGGDGEDPDWTRFSDNTRKAWENGQLEQRVRVCHVIMPNDDHRPDMLPNRYKAFYSCYWEDGSPMGTEGAERWLREEGFDEFPVLVPRWKVSGGDVYATSCPGMVALGDVKQLQLQERRGAQALEKMINPPMVGPTSLKLGAPNTLPGGITYVDTRGDQGGFRTAYEIKFPIDQLEAKNQQKREMINQAFFANLFLMLDSLEAARTSSQPVTAAEIAAREREKLLVLGPVLEQNNEDMLDPLIDRTFNIMLRRGMIPPAPPDLEGMPLKVEYISVMAQAQKIASLTNLERFATFAGQVAASRPDVLDKVDTDQLIDVYADATGVDPSLVVPDDQVAANRQARAKAMQQQQAAENAAKLAPAAKQVSEINTDRPNPLSDLLRGVGAPTGAI